MNKVEAGKIIGIRLFTGLVRVFFLCLLLSSFADSAVPVKFTYQGNLRQAGFLVNGQRNMTFRIFNSSDLPTGLLWTSPPYSVSLSTGVFRVTLEPSTISGVDWESGGLWLELQVEANTMSPREELTSSPYSINSLRLSGKRYTTSGSEPTVGLVTGDLWFDTGSGKLKYYNGSWTETSGGGGPHAASHIGTGTDPIVSLGTHTVTGSLTLEGALNPSANLLVGGGGYTVTFASSVSAGWFYGDGSGLDNLNASKISSGSINGDRIAAGVIVSTHIADRAITRQKFNQSGCVNGDVLKWNSGTTQWVCAVDAGAAGGDNLGNHIATITLNMNNFGIVNAASATFTNGVTASSATLTNTAGAGLIVSSGAYLAVSGGSVGIGTGVPQYRLHVSSGGGEAGTIMAVSTGTTDLFWVAGDGAHATKYYGDGSTLSGLGGTLSGGQTPKLPYWTGVNTLGNSTLSQDSANSLTVLNSTFTVQGNAFSVGGSTLVVIDGNVGISSSAPSYRLSVSSGAGETGTIMAVSTGASNVFWVQGDGAHAVKFHGDGSGLSNLTGAPTTAKWVGYSATARNGNRGGYATSNAECAAAYAGSHVCTNGEILFTINAGQLGTNFPKDVPLWINNGPPGYTANANDCNGWTSDAVGEFGALWNRVAAAGDGFGSLQPCNATAKFACCR